MMRHSKAQTMAGPAGQRSALVALPPKTEDVVLLPLSDACERAVYGEVRLNVFNPRPLHRQSLNRGCG